MFGQVEWATWKHGPRAEGPGWRKLHVGVDEHGVLAAVASTTPARRWKKDAGYQQARAENVIERYKNTIGRSLRARRERLR